jgi:hypothetical protein
MSTLWWLLITKRIAARCFGSYFFHHCKMAAVTQHGGELAELQSQLLELSNYIALINGAMSSPLSVSKGDFGRPKRIIGDSRPTRELETQLVERRLRRDRMRGFYSLFTDKVSSLMAKSSELPSYELKNCSDRWLSPRQKARAQTLAQFLDSEGDTFLQISTSSQNSRPSFCSKHTGLSFPLLTMLLSRFVVAHPQFVHF